MALLSRRSISQDKITPVLDKKLKIDIADENKFITSIISKFRKSNIWMKKCTINKKK